MHRVLLASALAGTLLVPAAASADPVQDAAARLAQKTTERAAATCRRDPVARDECQQLLGTPDASAAAVSAYEGSEVSRALDLQRALGDRLPLRAGLWIGTHNSANTTSEDPTLSTSDSNQQLSLTDQLRLDVRSLELDAHWFPSLTSLGQAPVLCHAQGAPTHVGCSTERLLADGLAEVRAWLDAHPREVVLLYLEDHLEAQAGHDRAAADVQAAFGDRLYAPAGGECTTLPLTLTRDAVRAAGKQVVVMTGGCTRGVGAAWHGVAFAETQREEDRPIGYGGYPRCGGADLSREDGVFRRYFEDTTFVNRAATLGGQAVPDDGITPATAAAMSRCGVDLLGLDQLVPGDGRLEALVWSFAPGELDEPGVAVQRAADGRWESAPAGGRLPAACRLPDGSWRVTGSGPRVSAAGRCGKLGGAFDVPRRGRDAQLLLEAQRTAGADRVWLALQSGAAGWS
ncbi:MAG: hypothetical protein JWM62_1405 [Frankiales bacterium]|nr:hypothetical protein [Frankiales bacterium]